jgi:hypothetical protein
MDIMLCKWVKTEDFDFQKETEFDCYIFWDGQVIKARFLKSTFSFNFGFCGRRVPTHVMKIPAPKPPAPPKY